MVEWPSYTVSPSSPAAPTSRSGKARWQLRWGARIKKHGKLSDVSPPAPIMKSMISSCKISQSLRFARPGWGDSSAGRALSHASVRSEPAWSTDSLGWYLNKQPSQWEPPPVDNCTQDIGYQQGQAHLLWLYHCELKSHSLIANISLEHKMRGNTISWGISPSNPWLWTLAMSIT